MSVQRKDFQLIKSKKRSIVELYNHLFYWHYRVNNEIRRYKRSVTEVFIFTFTWQTLRVDGWSVLFERTWSSCAWNLGNVWWQFRVGAMDRVQKFHPKAAAPSAYHRPPPHTLMATGATARTPVRWHKPTCTDDSRPGRSGGGGNASVGDACFEIGAASGDILLHVDASAAKAPLQFQRTTMQSFIHTLLVTMANAQQVCWPLLMHMRDANGANTTTAIGAHSWSF